MYVAIIAFTLLAIVSWLVYEAITAPSDPFQEQHDEAVKFREQNKPS